MNFRRHLIRPQSALAGNDVIKDPSFIAHYSQVEWNCSWPHVGFYTPLGFIFFFSGWVKVWRISEARRDQNTSPLKSHCFRAAQKCSPQTRPSKPCKWFISRRILSGRFPLAVIPFLETKAARFFGSFSSPNIHGGPSRLFGCSSERL